jgi:MFS family permease
MANVAVPLLAVVALHAGPFTVGLLTALEFAPWLLVSLPAGALLDRVRRREVMIACDVIAALLFASIPVAAWAGALTTAQVLVVALLSGSAAVFSQTAYQAYLPDLLPASEVAAGNAALQAGVNTARLSGPGLGGYAVQALGAAPALLFNALSFLVSAGCLARIGPEPGTRPRRPSASAGGLRGDIVEGARFVFRDPYLRPMTLWAATVNFGLTGYTALAVLFLVRVVHVGAGAVGLLTASSGVGAIAGSLIAGRVAGRLGTARGFLIGAFLAEPLALVIPLTGSGPRLVFFAAGNLAFYVGIAMTNVLVATFRQTYPPPDMRARITATTWCLLNGVYPPGALLGGGLGIWLGIRNGICVMLAVMVLGNAFLFARPLWRHRDLPSQSPLQP